MYTLDISTQESAHSTCDCCDWSDDQTGHVGVIDAGNHAADHVMITGHCVTEKVVKEVTMINSGG